MFLTINHILLFLKKHRWSSNTIDASGNSLCVTQEDKLQVHNILKTNILIVMIIAIQSQNFFMFKDFYEVNAFVSPKCYIYTLYVRIHYISSDMVHLF